jgi:ABC-type Zn uptake system ZnuABC Zn-binding protein ZnuA
MGNPPDLFGRALLLVCLKVLVACVLVACASPGRSNSNFAEPAAESDTLDTVTEGRRDGELAVLELPALSPVPLEGRKLKVVATTSIIGDVVANVGGDAIELVALMDRGQDPHSYEPAARDLTAAAAADVLFINGWGLEQGLANDLATIGEDALVVAVSAGVEPLAFGEGRVGSGEWRVESEERGADPHVWLSVPNVMQWVRNVERVLSVLDPANVGVYQANAEGYLAELEELDNYVREQVAEIPPEQRVMVTNHDTFGYFANEYGFAVLGTVLPASSTLAEPSASDLAGLVEMMTAEGACTLFTENTVSDQLVQTVSNELAHCDNVQVVRLYTDSLGPAGSGAESYLGMMQANMEAIVSGLQ